MIYDLQSFESYFTAFKDRFGINTVVTGGYNELIALQNNAVVYPVLVAETPELTEDIDGYFTFLTRIAVLLNGASAMPTPEYKTKLNESRLTLSQILKAIHADSANVVFRPYEIKYEFIERGQVISSDTLFGCIALDISIKSQNPCS